MVLKSGYVSFAGGGDCEDSAILFASMIKAAPIEWDLQLVYIDSDNPTNPKNVNHVLVSIDTGESNYLIETTNKEEIQPFKSIDGWHFDI